MAEATRPIGYAPFHALLAGWEDEAVRAAGDAVESLIATPGWAAVCRLLGEVDQSLIGDILNPEGGFDESMREIVKTLGQVGGLRMVPVAVASIRYAAAESREQAETADPGVPGEGGTEQ